MAIDKSSKSGKNDFIDKHHILPKKYRSSKRSRRIKLTVSEHREIHMLSDGLNKNGILSVFMKWLFGNDKC